ncbi:hypothetical protein [Crossiella sp. CA198]|uniref:hypothetical protein n=1 Tax=Crossiella sp. CA198 TaxID=3455607 RepID=UPI003F8D05EE
MPETVTTATIPSPRELLELASQALDSLQDSLGYHPQVRRQAHLYNDLAELVWRCSPDRGLVAKAVQLLAGHPRSWVATFITDIDERLALAEGYIQLAETSALFNSRA